MSFYTEDVGWWKKHVRTPLRWFFAVALGLLVSVADIKLPAETSEAPFEDPVQRVSTDPVPDGDGLVHAARGQDLSAFVFVPTEEPALGPMDLLIHEAAGRHDVDADLIRAIIMAESRFDPVATSHKGAMGLMQLMPVTAIELEVINLFDPEENIHAGVKYFRTLLDRFEGNVKLALAAYNAGSRNVLRHDGVPPYRETRLFISKVFGYYTSFKEDALE